MAAIINCPLCSTPIGKIGNSGVFKGICASCKFQYGAVYGKLSGRLSQKVTLISQTSKRPGAYRRKHEFRITTPAKKLETFNFSTPGEDDCFFVWRGDIVSIIYTIRGNSIEEIIAINNHTTSNSYKLLKPGSKACRNARYIGILVAVLTFTTLACTFPVASGIWVVISIGLGIAAFILLEKQLIPKAKLKAHEETRLIWEQGLLSQKHELQQRLNQLDDENKVNLDLINQLQSLRQKMLDVGEDIYVSRVEVINKANKLIRQQVSNEQRLIEDYGKIIKLIDIEYETSNTAAQIPVETMSKILDRLDELKIIEERNQELKFQLEANEEVRRLRT